MMDNSLRLVLVGMMWAGVFMGLIALVTLIWRNRLSRKLGAISLACIYFSFWSLDVSAGRLPKWLFGVIVGAVAIPGLLAMIFQRTPPVPPPGHCTTCGYNLTGNVSGKCSECGEPVPAP